MFIFLYFWIESTLLSKLDMIGFICLLFYFLHFYLIIRYPLFVSYHKFIWNSGFILLNICNRGRILILYEFKIL